MSEKRIAGTGQLEALTLCQIGGSDPTAALSISRVLTESSDVPEDSVLPVELDCGYRAANRLIANRHRAHGHCIKEFLSKKDSRSIFDKLIIGMVR